MQREAQRNYDHYFGEREGHYAILPSRHQVVAVQRTPWQRHENAMATP